MPSIPKSISGPWNLFTRCNHMHSAFTYCHTEKSITLCYRVGKLRGFAWEFCPKNLKRTHDRILAQAKYHSKMFEDSKGLNPQKGQTNHPTMNAQWLTALKQPSLLLRNHLWWEEQGWCEVEVSKHPHCQVNSAATISVQNWISHIPSDPFKFLQYSSPKTKPKFP